MNPKNRSHHGIGRRSVLSMSIAAAVTPVAAGVAGCSGSGSDKSGSDVDKKIEHPGDNLQQHGFPIVEDPITMHIMIRRFATNAKNFNKVASWKKYQKMTNIEVDWDLEPLSSIEEKRNLALGSGDYPEAFHGCRFATLDVGKYADQGIFIRLNKLIDNYMPNFKKLMERVPDVKAGITFPDGGIYGLPSVRDPESDTNRIYNRMWVRGDWIKKHDLDVPSTTSEYHKYLKACKKSEGSRGYCDETHLDDLLFSLAGSFGVGNRGRGHEYVDADPSDDSKLRFYRIADGYKDLLEYMHQLYREGLIASDALSIEDSKFYNNLAKNIYSSTTIPGTRGYGAKGFTSTPALKGPDGKHAWNGVLPAVTSDSIGQFVITDKCKHPVAAARWIDYFYGKKGMRLFLMGVEGKSYTMTKDGPEFIDKITNPPEGVNSDEVKKPYTTQPGGSYPGILTEGVQPRPTADVRSAVRKLAPDAPKGLWGPFTYSQDEHEKLDSLSTDIEKYVDESFGRFVSGDIPLAQWNKYVDKVRQMGLDDYMEIKQTAYDRYRKHR